MTEPGQSVIWIVSDDAGQGDACIRAVYGTAEAAYAAAEEIGKAMVDPSTLRVIGARGEAVTHPGGSVTRGELESDEAFMEAEDVLRRFFGEPPREEEWADVYGGIIDAVLAKLVTLQRITHGRHCACGACAAQDWAEPGLVCGMHGPSCPQRYDMLGNAGSMVARR